MPHPTIQDLARRAKAAHNIYGHTDATTERLMLDVLDAIIEPSGKIRTIDVDPGTLVEYAGVGIAVNCDYNSDASGRQPFVTVNTEELNIMHRYGPDHGMPAIAVHLNDVELFDDEGQGDYMRGAISAMRAGNETDALALLAKATGIDRELSYAVIDTAPDSGPVKVGEQYPVLGRFATEDEASAFIATQPDYLDGRYGLDGPER